MEAGAALPRIRASSDLQKLCYRGGSDALVAPSLLGLRALVGEARIAYTSPFEEGG
jgi:hypothetical protein